MPPGFLRYYGAYHYSSREHLDRAVAAAWSRFDEEEVARPALGSIGHLIKHGSRLHVDLTLSTAADARHAAAGMFDVLASAAIAGSVEARLGTEHVDYFCVGDDD
jgi:hypothetical protein